MESLDVGDLVEEMNISGPGFINIKLSDTYLKSKITNMLTDSSGRLGIPGTWNAYIIQWFLLVILSFHLYNDFYFYWLQRPDPNSPIYFYLFS